MKKLVAILVIFIFALGTVSAFAADAAKTTAAKGDSTVKTFFSDAKDLVTKQIPETPDKKSATHRIFDKTGTKASKEAAAATK